MYLKVKDNPDLVREKNSNAILNTNTQELDKYRIMRAEKLKMDNIIKEQESIKTDLAEVKNMLNLILGKLDR